ncbi:CpXC domain-containing protein [Elusimicrobiota bacterium]
MSASILEKIHCSCGEEFEAEVWTSVDVEESPNLREALICGEINVVTCPNCRQLFHVEHFLLYNDRENELLAFVYPESFQSQAAHLDEKMHEDVKKVAEESLPEDRITYEPVLLFGINSLVDLVNEELDRSDEEKILEYIADENNLSLVKIKPSFARLHKMPRILPFTDLENQNKREEIIGGLEVLLKKNNLLTHYAQFLDIIKSDPNWSLDKHCIK